MSLDNLIQQNQDSKEQKDEETTLEQVEHKEDEVDLTVKDDVSRAVEVTENQKRTKAKTKKGNKMPIYLALGAFVLVLGGLGSFILYKKNMSDDSNMAVIAQMQAEQEQKLAQQTQPQTMDNEPEKTFNSEEKVNLAVQAQKGELNIQTEQEINFGAQQSMTFTEDGDIYNPNAKVEKPKTIKEILATKALDELTNEELFAAFQIIDRSRVENEDSIQAISERMVEKGLTPPVSVIDEKRKKRDLQIAETIRNDMTEKFAKILYQLNENVTLLNHNQVRMKKDFESAIHQISSKIEIDKIEAEKNKIRYDELSKANHNLLSKYSISSIVNNRVWLKTKGQAKTLSYTIGDVIADGIVVEAIDKTNQIVHTSKGNIR